MVICHPRAKRWLDESCRLTCICGKRVEAYADGEIWLWGCHDTVPNAWQHYHAEINGYVIVPKTLRYRVFEWLEHLNQVINYGHHPRRHAA
jgi:hypothetical protein